MREDTKSLQQHLEEFKTVGFTIFPKMLDASWVKAIRDSFEEIADRIPNPDGSRSATFVDMLEHKPDLILPAMTNKRLLDFAEMIVGPHVQLESITYRRTAPEDPKTNPVLGFHRDMFAEFPQDNVYHRPLLFNALSYLQDLDDKNGPLRILPGSHMKAMSLTSEEKIQPHPDEVIVYPQAGDVAVFHNAMLHSGTANYSKDYRYLFFLTMNHSWLKHRANYSGPVSESVKARARVNGDHRLLRLLGEDGKFVQRANSGFTQPDELMWEKWIADDSADLKVDR
jgi:hypothetical protein